MAVIKAKGSSIKNSIRGADDFSRPDVLLFDVWAEQIFFIVSWVCKWWPVCGGFKVVRVLSSLSGSLCHSAQNYLCYCSCEPQRGTPWMSSKRVQVGSHRVLRDGSVEAVEQDFPPSHIQTNVNPSIISMRRVSWHSRVPMQRPL